MMVPVIAITAVVLVFVFFAPKTASELDKKMKEFKTVQSEEVVLSAKLESLRGISPDLLDSEDVTVIALPSKNPGLWIVSQIRRSSRETEISITEMSVTNIYDSGDIKSSDIEFELEANEYQSLLAFIEDMTVMLPVYSLNLISVNREKGQRNIFRGEVKATFFWSDFPKTLPPINEPINKLTDDEIKLLEVITAFKRPIFTELTPGQPQDRPQPFN